MKIKSILLNKRFLISVGILILIVVAALVYVVMNLESMIENNKEYFISQAEQALGRDVSIDQIKVKIWGGVGANISDFTLSDHPDFSDQNFIQTDALRVNLKLWPLLQKKVEVSQFVLSNPKIQIIRNQEGQFNFSTIAKTGEESASEETSSNSTSLTVALLRIDNGEIHYIDRQNDKELNIRQVDLDVSNFSFDRQFSVNLTSAFLADQKNVSIESQIGPLGESFDYTKIPMNGTVKIDSFPTKQLLNTFPFLAEKLPQGLTLQAPVNLAFDIAKENENISLSEIDLQTGLFGSEKSNVQFTGKADLNLNAINNMSVNGNLDLDSIASTQLANLEPVKNALPQDLRIEGPLSAQTHLEGTIGNLLVKGKLNASNSAIQYGSLLNKEKGITLTVNTDSKIAPQTITINQLDMQLKNLSLKGNGEIGRGKTTTITLALNSNPTNLNELKDVVPLLQDYDPAGNVEMDVNIKKQSQTPQIDGTITLDSIRLKHPSLANPITDLNGNIQFSGNQAQTKELALQIGQSKFGIEANANKLTPLHLDYLITSPELFLADINTALESSNKPNVIQEFKTDGQVVQAKDVYNVKGKVSSPNGTLYNLTYSDLKGDINLDENVLSVDNLSAQTLSGTLNGTLTYDMNDSPPSFDLNLQTQKIDIAEYFSSALISLPKSVEGLLNANISVSGNGTGWESIKPTLTGKGSAEILDGMIIDTNIAEGVLSGMTGIQGLSNFLSPAVEKNYPKIFQNKNTIFDQLKASIQIENGKINFDNLLVSAAEWAVNANGFVNFNQMLDAEGTLKLSKGFTDFMTKQAKFFQYLTDQQGQASIPFSLNGTIPGVKPSPNASFLTQTLQQALMGKGVEELKKQGLPIPSEFGKLLNIGKQSQETDTQQPKESTSGQKAGSPFEELTKQLPIPQSATKSINSATSATPAATQKPKSPGDLLKKAAESIFKR